MSETTETADAAKKVTDQAIRAGQAVMDAAATATKDTMIETSHVAHNVTDGAEAAGQGATGTMTEIANAAANLSAKAAEQSRDVMLAGVRTAAGIGGRVADLSSGRGHDLLASAVQATDIYRDASERSAERVQALFSSAVTWGRGLRRMQQAWLQMVDNSIKNAAHKPQDLLHAKNVVELIEVQRELYIDAIDHAFESTGRLFDLAAQAAQDAARTLRSRAN